MKHCGKQFVSLWIVALLMTTSLSHAQKAGALKINHTPVTWAVKGQSLTLKTRITGGVGGIDNVTLYYALFRDAAPFRVAMASSGMDTFVGTIDAGLLTGVEHVSYYIEAMDREGTVEETPWYDVKFKNPENAPINRTGTNGSTSPPTGDEGMSALTIGLIAGGAVAVGAGAYFLSDSGGSDDGDGGGGGGGGTVTTNAGNYAGNSTLCKTSQGSGTTCETTAATFVIDSAGKIFTDTLSPGRSMTGTVVDNEFSLVADLTGSAEGLTGTAVYTGTILSGSRIVGTITGNFDTFGVPGTFSGSFSATRQ